MTLTRTARRMAVALLFTLSGWAVPWLAQAQPGTFPNRPITVVIPYSAGSQNDTLCRLLSDGIREELGQPLVIINRGGGGTLIGTQQASRAEPDGHTLLMAASTLTVQPAINPNFTINVLRDLVPVVEAVRGDFLIVGRADMPARNLRELIDLARQSPGKLSYATNGNGSSGHITMEYFGVVTGTEFLHVPYAGAGDALNSLLAGNVTMMNNTVSTLRPFVQQGKLRAFAVTGAKRSDMMPDVPTVAESGYPGFNVQYWQGFFAPPKTPPEIVAKLNAAFVKTLHRPEVVARLSEMGLIVVASKPEEFRETLRGELVAWKQLVTDRKLKMD